MSTDPPSARSFYPETPAELAQILTQAHQEQIPTLPTGRGSKLSWGRPTDAGLQVVSTRRLNRLIDHAAADLTATVGAGMKLVDLQTQLAEGGQFWPVDPFYANQATIGGLIATADTGSWRQGYGGIRDHLLGITFVRADGEMVKAGGRVVKNVAGYDLMKLLTGSYGTLGILTQVSLRLYPLPATRILVKISGSDLEGLGRILMASSLTPAGLDLWSVAGQDPLVVIEFHGSEVSVAAQLQQVLALAQDQTVQVIEGAEVEPTKQALQAHLETGSEVLVKLGVLPNQAAKTIHWIRQADMASVVRIHLASGIGYGRLDPQVDGIAKLRDQLDPNSGFLTILESPAELKEQVDVWGYAPSVIPWMKKVKQQFDPQGLLSPGRLW